MGKPNVGKSSLLNAFLGEDRAIVTDIAGTTRDVVEGHVNIDGVVLHLYDTAGIRDSEDKIESIGIEKSKKTIKEADIVVVLLDSSNDLDEEDKQILEYTKEYNPIVVYNKADKNASNKASMPLPFNASLFSFLPLYLKKKLKAIFTKTAIEIKMTDQISN